MTVRILPFGDRALLAELTWRAKGAGIAVRAVPGPDGPNPVAYLKRPKAA